MLIEPLQNITVRLPGGVKVLEPGKTYDLPAPQAEKLLALAPERVRVIEPVTVKVGDHISYRVQDDPTEGPFQVVEVVPDKRRRGWWALVEKPCSLVWIHEKIVTRVER